MTAAITQTPPGPTAATTAAAGSLAERREGECQQGSPAAQYRCAVRTGRALGPLRARKSPTDAECRTMARERNRSGAITLPASGPADRTGLVTWKVRDLS